MSENVDGMQTMLNVFSEYCNTWKLEVNVAKTKVIISSKRKVTQNTRFMFDNKELDICESYNYLGIQLRKCEEQTCRASTKGFILRFL
jgi:hypothetical protein